MRIADKISIECKNIEIRYGERTIISNFCYNFLGPNLYLIKGKSGSGKSSLVNVIAQILKPHIGSIDYIFDCDKESNMDKLRKDKIGYLFQDMMFIEELTALENFEIFSLINSQTINNEKLYSYSSKLGVANLLNTPISVLSGGERQRLALLKFCIYYYPILLIDEPTNNLDIENIEVVREILSELATNSLVICISHDENISCCTSNIINLENYKLEEQHV